MKKIFLSTILLIICTTSYEQNNIETISDSLVAEGQRLYESEMASWYGTDIFLENIKIEQNSVAIFPIQKMTAPSVFFSPKVKPKSDWHNFI